MAYIMILGGSKRTEIRRKEAQQSTFFDSLSSYLLFGRVLVILDLVRLEISLGREDD